MNGVLFVQFLLYHTLGGSPCVSSRGPQTQPEWVQLLDSQHGYHDDELQKWREMIQSSVLLLDKVSQLLTEQVYGQVRDYFKLGGAGGLMSVGFS